MNRPLPLLDAPANRDPAAATPGARRRLPAWLKKRWPTDGSLPETARIIRDSGIATVCQEAHCPNRLECWSRRTATFMILGDRCTRRCHYCAVSTARPDPPEPDEPQRLALAAAELGLRHVVITAVARDDLPDEGAAHFAECVRALRRASSAASIEVLPADFHARSELIETLCRAQPDVYNHNIETVERLTPVIRPQGKYRRSLEVLRIVRRLRPGMPTKSGLMVGLGETPREIRQVLIDLRQVDCNILTVGQYLQPSPNHAPVQRFVAPDEFDEFAAWARELGFRAVYSGPFVRSSYNAAEVFEESAAQSA